MSSLLMPKATAVWLIENTSLTFKQISDFVSIHPFEIQAMADGDAAKDILPRNPLTAQQLSQEEIKRCENDPQASLNLLTSDLPAPKKRLKGPRYTPLVKRAEKPDAIAWLVRHHPLLNDAQIVRLVGTTRNSIQSIRDRSYWNYANIKMRSPVELDMTTQEDLDAELKKHEIEEKNNNNVSSDDSVQEQPDT